MALMHSARKIILKGTHLSMFRLFKHQRTETKVDDDPLCLVCSALDFRTILRDGIPREHAVVLGHLTDIVKKDNQCGFCRLVSVNYQYLSQPGIDLSGTTCRLYTMANPPSLSYGDVRHSLHVAATGAYGNTQIRLLKEIDSKTGRAKKFYDQRVGETVDVGLLKRWIQNCEKNHRKTCRTDWWDGTGKDLLRNMRVVDVDLMAIILAPPNRHYLALSYVWGPREDDAYWTIRANLKQRSLPGGLDASMMPNTILDTIQLVRQLGERYVWIDALCIVQDDPKDKEVQINVMNLIYGHSALTICAVGCTSVRDTLPGIRPDTRAPKQHIATVQGLQLALPLPNDRTVVYSTSWNNRGWTYQETMLSRRRVLLTGEQMHFECRYGSCSEQMPATVIDVAVLGQALPASAPPAVGRGPCLTLYTRIVEEYTRRELTEVSDIVDAVAALLRVLTKAFKLADGDYDKAFGFGMLLTGCLDQALLWQPVANGPHLRRVSPKATWPSWSWAAWLGGIRYVSADLFGNIHADVPSNDSIGQSLVQWYTVDDDGQPVRHHVEHPPKSMFERDVDSTTNIPSIAITGKIDPQQLVTENARLVPGTLIFWTSYSRFDVIKIDSVESASSAVANYAIFSILSDIPQPSTSIGRIILPSSTHSPTSYEFVVLSRGRGAGGFYDKFGGFYDTKRLGEKYFKCMLNVMAVQKMKDEDRFERVGVGIIFEPAWLNSKPGEKIVYLG
jgi:hypothetical protein